MQRICITLVFLFALAIGMQAQPTTFGSTLVDGNYASYNLTDKGAFRQVRLQAANSAGTLTRNWNFALGTAGNQDFSNSWRPYSGSCNGNSNLSISNYNQVIAPDLSFPSGTASAPLNNNGGCDGFFPAVAGGRYYTVNITESGGNNHMAILETAYAPATIDDVSGPACATNCGYTVTVTLSGPPASGEYVYVRYSTDGFATSGLAEVSNFTGAAGTAAIPDQGGSTVVYYAYTSPNTL
ncbi:MAG: hypothetical protein KDD09_25920, partial [Phaeodactylibacter sp.]|nr:hypothetical protein [Phaeodactylibacter sp.]